MNCMWIFNLPAVQILTFMFSQAVRGFLLLLCVLGSCASEYARRTLTNTIKSGNLIYIASTLVINRMHLSILFRRVKICNNSSLYSTEHAIQFQKKARSIRKELDVNCFKSRATISTNQYSKRALSEGVQRIAMLDARDRTYARTPKV